MNERLMQFLRCPSCLSNLRLIVYQAADSTTEISAGLLVCQCEARYPIWKGVPRMLMPGNRILPAGYLEQFRQRLLREAPEFLYEGKSQQKTRGYSFDMQWSMYEYGELTWELDLQTRVKYFYDYVRRKPGSLNKALVLDAGCGNGTLTAGIAASGPEIIGMDYSESVEKGEQEKKRFAGEASSRVHFVQGDVQHPPFAPEIFDVVYSDGVLHHTPNTKMSFCALAPLVKQDGQYFVWLYRSDLSPMFNVKLKTAKALQSILSPLPLPVLKYLCFSGAAILLLRLRFLRLFGNRKRRIVPLRLKAVNLFDTLTPRYYHLHTPAEVYSWFASSGFADAVDVSIPSLSHGGFGMLGTREGHYRPLRTYAASASGL
jgi:SAM-dependent methyltransferase